MKNVYNFNVGVEVPEKSSKEQILFLKWKPILRRIQITNEIIEEYKNDLLSLKLKPMKIIILLLFSTISFAQSDIVVAGGDRQSVSYTIGAGLVELQIPIVKETSLAVPTFELPEPPKPKPIKKQSFIEKIIALFKSLFKK